MMRILKVTDKPRISRDLFRPGKWQCVSHRVSAWGADVEVIGKGYSPRLAYIRWTRSWANVPRSTR